MQNLVRPLAFALTLVASGALVHDATNTWCRTERIEMVRRQALSGSRTANRTKSAAARTAYNALKPAIAASCLPAPGDGTVSSHVMPQGAIAYAWLLNHASADLKAAGSSDSGRQGEAGNDTCLGILHPLIGDDMRPLAWLPRRLRAAVAANVQQCSTHCGVPSCKPTNMNVWSAYRSEAAQYTRHPACSYDARLSSTECGYLRRLRWRRIWVSSYGLGCRQADMRRPLVDIRDPLPGDSRADPRSG
ncbi:hypothetical protein [Burkholderia anthina]|uniref:hypothetical protein n=1 Tax=Burkholderia anthina TaxID=179879 RepID=UPI0015887524|nr:hypothetical protein [Burkholderia anthina]